MRLLSLLIAAHALFAQSPAFEVATVKLSSPEEHVIGMFTWPGGRITVTNYTLNMLIHDAYGVQDFQILGSPKWAGEERYSIVAKPAAGSPSSKINPANPKLPPPQEEVLMLRTLLADRFQLKLREETREGTLLALALTNRTPELKDAKDKETFPVVVYGRTGIAERPDFMRGENASMPRFAKRLSDMLHRPVIDETGLSGTFDFKFEYVQSLSESAEGPSLFSAVRQLGLKLVPTKAPILHLVIEHAEKPSAN